jgi:hypothetical protein
LDISLIYFKRVKFITIRSLDKTKKEKEKKRIVNHNEMGELLEEKRKYL